VPSAKLFAHVLVSKFNPLCHVGLFGRETLAHVNMPCWVFGLVWFDSTSRAFTRAFAPRQVSMATGLNPAATSRLSPADNVCGAIFEPSWAGLARISAPLNEQSSRLFLFRAAGCVLSCDFMLPIHGEMLSDLVPALGKYNSSRLEVILHPMPN